MLVVRCAQHVRVEERERDVVAGRVDDDVEVVGGAVLEVHGLAVEAADVGPGDHVARAEAQRQLDRLRRVRLARTGGSASGRPHSRRVAGDERRRRRRSSDAATSGGCAARSCRTCRPGCRRGTSARSTRRTASTAYTSFSQRLRDSSTVMSAALLPMPTTRMRLPVRSSGCVRVDVGVRVDALAGELAGERRAAGGPSGGRCRRRASRSPRLARPACGAPSRRPAAGARALDAVLELDVACRPNASAYPSRYGLIWLWCGKSG